MSIKLSSFLTAWSDFSEVIEYMIAQNSTISVLELGAGARPFLSQEQVVKYNLDYEISDSNVAELEKSENSFYSRRLIDLSKNKLDKQYDLIFSKMLLEHVEYPDQFHLNLRHLMHDSTRVVHFFATKYSLSSILNLLLPDRISDFIVYRLQGRDPHDSGKFKAYYRRCVGPSKSGVEYFEKANYSVQTYNGYLGHDYLKKLPILNWVENVYSKLLLKCKLSCLTSNSILVLKKKN